MMMTRRGIAMIETVLATAIVGGLTVAALSLVSSAAMERRVSSERTRGMLLASQLAEEIAARPVQVGTPITADPILNRLLFDEVADYDGLRQSPPRERDGTALVDTDGWTRTVDVTEVAASDLEGPEVADTGVYRVTVRAEFAGRIAGEVVMYRSSAADGVLR
ncbi:MAG: hypothetical protein AAFS11_06375 [Planctomycetota bacterium]